MGNAFGRAGDGRGNDRDGDRPYRYPPPHGLYFGNTFALGGQEFAMMNPESFLFGDTSDLNFLSQLPGTSQESPPNLKHTVTVRSLVSLQRDSLRLVRHADAVEALDEYHLEFSFDSDCKCEVTVYYFVRESTKPDGSQGFQPWNVRSQEDPMARSPSMMVPPVAFEAGLGQVYRVPSSPLKGLASLPPECLVYNQDESLSHFPCIIKLEAINPPTPQGSIETPEPHTHMTYCNFELQAGGAGFVVKPLIQKINVQGLTYVLKEIYGLEKSGDHGDPEEEEEEEDSTECVICMSDARDTMVLPCRHLCLCNPCAEVLRFQADKCPICRAPFHSLLQIRVARKTEEVPEDILEDLEGQEDAPPGYSLVPIGVAMQPSASTPAGGEEAGAGATNQNASAGAGYLEVAGKLSDEDSSFGFGAPPDGQSSAPRTPNRNVVRVEPIHSPPGPSARGGNVAEPGPGSPSTTIDFSGDGVVEGHEVSLPGTPATTPPSTSNGSRSNSGQDAALEAGLATLGSVVSREEQASKQAADRT